MVPQHSQCVQRLCTVADGEASDGGIPSTSSVADTSLPAATASSTSTASSETAGVSACVSTPSGCVAQSSRARILFTVDQSTQVGVRRAPVAITFNDNHDVIVACNYRVQRFDHSGRLEAIDEDLVLRPAGVAITKDGLLAVSDELSRTVRFFHNNGCEVSLARRQGCSTAGYLYWYLICT